MKSCDGEAIPFNAVKMAQPSKQVLKVCGQKSHQLYVLEQRHPVIQVFLKFLSFWLQLQLQHVVYVNVCMAFSAVKSFGLTGKIELADHRLFIVGILRT